MAEALHADVVEEIETLLGAPVVEELDFEALEIAVRDRTRRVAAGVFQQRLNRDTSDGCRPQRACGCGQMARYVDRRSKSFQSVLGELKLERAYYYCSACQRGFCPRDRALGLAGSSLTPAVIRMIGAVGATVSFEEGSALLNELAGLHIDPKQVERTAETLGVEVAQQERTQVEPAPESEIRPTLYLGLDGTNIPMRANELEGRAGKQPDGSAKTREVKLCTAWSAESRDAKGLPVRDEGSVTYSAALESAASLDTDAARSEFAERVLREAIRRGFDRAPRQVVLGDCASWIWNTATELFPNAIQIADRFHVKENLSKVAKAIYGKTNPEAPQWAKLRHDELDAEQIDSIVQALAEHSPHCQEARTCIDYFQRHRQRMRYCEFHAQGLCTSSGVVEAGCKVAIGARLKHTGMHWSVRGADAIIALRCSRLSGRFEDFWERRSARRRAA